MGGSPPQRTPSGRQANPLPPIKSSVNYKTMNHLYQIAGFSIVAKSFVEALAYYRDYCMNQNG